MHSSLVVFPSSIKALTAEEKANWPVSAALAVDGSQVVVSRYGDDIWDFWPLVPQENKADSHKCINWGIKLQGGELLTDDKHAALLESCKDFLWSLFAEPIEGRKRPKMMTMIGWTKDPIPCLVRWMSKRGLTQFSQLAGCAMEYVIHAKRGVRPKTATKRLSLLENIHYQSHKISDGLLKHPWPFEFAAGLSGEASMPDRYKPKTPLIPELIWKQIGIQAITYVENQAADILDVRDAILAAGGNRKVTYSQRASTVVAQAAGYAWARDHSHDLVMLRTACYIVIAMFSGVRDSELLSLGAGCIEHFMTKDAVEARWMHGTIYKTGQRPKKWLVPPVVETAVLVMERLSAPMRTALATEEQWLLSAGILDGEGIKRLHKVQHQKDKLFLVADSKRSNRISVMTHARSLLIYFCKRFNIFGDDGMPWALAPHQFRRAFAYYYAKSEMGDLLYLQEHFGHHSLDMTLLYSDAGIDNYEADTELLEMIAEAKQERQVEILTGFLNSDMPLAAGEQWLGDWRHTIRTAKNKEELIEDLSGTLSLTGTGHSWCAGSAKGTGCGSRCMFEPDMCTECDWAIISFEHLSVWREIAKQQEFVIASDDIGAPGKTLARRILGKANTVITKLEGETGNG
jgi:integrase